MLIDDFMPVYDFSEKHETVIRASAADIYKALKEADFSESFVVRWLMRLRGMSVESITLRSFRKSRFELLAETQNEELLIGLAGKFWTPAGSLQKVDAGNFREFDKPGFAKATWNFTLQPLEGDAGVTDAAPQTRALTETRIQCMDDKSRSSFGFYWTFIQPFSGWIRNEMLAVVKKNAERLATN